MHPVILEKQTKPERIVLLSVEDKVVLTAESNAVGSNFKQKKQFRPCDCEFSSANLLTFFNELQKKKQSQHSTWLV